MELRCNNSKPRRKEGEDALSLHCHIRTPHEYIPHDNSYHWTQPGHQAKDGVHPDRSSDHIEEANVKSQSKKEELIEHV